MIKCCPEPFVRIPVEVTGHGGLLGITIDPDYSVNHYIYLYYTSKNAETNEVFDRVVRFTELDNKATQERILIPQIPVASDGLHMGGAMAFGPDKKALYFNRVWHVV